MMMMIIRVREREKKKIDDLRIYQYITESRKEKRISKRKRENLKSDE